MHDFAEKRLNEVEASLRKETNDHEFAFFVDGDIDQGPNSHYFYRQIVSTAKELEYYANTRYYRSWVCLKLITKGENQGNILITFHSIGHDFQGVLACSGTWFVRAQTDDGTYETGGEKALSDEVFQINYKEAVEDVQIRFEDWLARVLDRGLTLWESTL